MTVQLAGVILARNEAGHIQACIESLKWTDHVVVFESGSSTDNTIELAQAAGAEVISHPFENYSKQRSAALAAVDAEWVLFVDADERATPEVEAEVRRIIANPQHMGYWIPRHNYIFGKLTRFTGWYPDYQMRLLKRDQATYDPERRVHEVPILKTGEPGHLENPLIHYNYRDIGQFIEKQRLYARYDAEIMKSEGQRAKFRNFILQPLRQFRWRYLTLKGYRDGLHGLRLSLLMAWNEFDKYWQLRRLWQEATR
ncbi:MAG: glycosyltransferase family 2 protein [Anaerolineae bacterium]|nr:MAG: glycosyltransferase family 2 protein [Anaerolineae bacterium]